MRGCFERVFFTTILLICFGSSSYFWFKYFVRGRSVATPQLIGKDLTRARGIAQDRGLILVVEPNNDRPSNTVPKGAVVWQNRPGGSLIKRGTRMYVGLSLGPTILSVPDLSGQSPRTALLRFSQRNLQLGNLSYMDIPGGKGIIAEDPPRGTVVPGQTAVSLLVGFPPTPPRYVMPDLIDRQLEQVRPALEVNGLKVTNVRFESYPGIADGTIIRQYPQAGSAVSQNDAITLVVTKDESGFVPSAQQPPAAPPPPA